MSKRSHSKMGAMLELWRPPKGAGEPIGCLTSTYTFSPGLFDEQCLARFLEIESEPDREGLAFLLERESRLGSVYAGVLVDYTKAGVEHSLRWDVLPVRVRGGKQHAKLTLLAWSRHLRIIVSSANLSQQGYRTNFEVTGVVNCTADSANHALVSSSLQFMRRLLRLVPSGEATLPEVVRCEDFLASLEKQVRPWKNARGGKTVRRDLVCTLPAGGAGVPGRSALEEAIEACRGRGASPHTAWMASPFFDLNEQNSPVTEALCKKMAKGRNRTLRFCVPSYDGVEKGAKPRLAAPKALLLSAQQSAGDVRIQILPESDTDQNRRPWHAKMLALIADDYSALMVGSSNFTSAGMGISGHRNTEANLMTVVDREAFSRQAGEIEAIWPDMNDVKDPDGAEWLGAKPDKEEDEGDTEAPLPAGFLSATYRAGDDRKIVICFDPLQLPDDWQVKACGADETLLLASIDWKSQECPSSCAVDWGPIQPPERLLVVWEGHQAFLPLNVEDGRCLPPPPKLDEMTSDDMLLVLAASDPSAAFRVWTRKNRKRDDSDDDLDTAVPVDLDPLRRHDLHATYLHRIRRRARVLAQLRSNLQRPVWGKQALEWRLRGLLGVEALADRLVRECIQGAGSMDEGLLTLADFLIVLREVDYQASDESISKAAFEAVYRPFLGGLADKLVQRTAAHRTRVSNDVLGFWDRTVKLCQN